MRILIDDGMQIKVGTGIGKYSLYLYDNLKKLLGNEQVDVVEFDKGDMSKKRGRLKYMCYINSKAFCKKSGQYDIVHFTNYAMPVRRNKNVKYVVTIHDLASFLHSESLSKLYKLYNQLVIRYAMKYADVILTVSHSVEREISDIWPQYASKVKVAYPGLYEEFVNNTSAVKNTYDLAILNQLEKRKFFLYVGTIEARKNIGFIIDAFIEWKKKNKKNKFKLVLAGREGFGIEGYKKKVEASNIKDDIIMTGYISSQDVSKLYSQAAAYIFPTVYEGFGSTQLECMAYGLPLILSSIPTNHEVSDSYGFFFELDNMEMLMGQMDRVANHKFSNDELKKIGDRILSEFDWKVLVKDYVKYYKSIED